LRRVPTDLRVARFIEERAPSLDDRLVTAVDVAASRRESASPAIAGPMLTDAAARARAVDVETILAAETLRRAGFQAGAAALIVLALMFVGRERAREAYDAAALLVFPEHVRLDVTPGNARVKAGSPFAIEASLAGNRAPVTPLVQMQTRDVDVWRDAAMTTDRSGRFRLSVESVTTPFKYRVIAGPRTSPVYNVAVVHPPRVARIDVDYIYPASSGLKPRTEEDSGDVSAPAGPDVRRRTRTDRPAATGQMTLNGGKAIALSPTAPDVLVATL